MSDGGRVKQIDMGYLLVQLLDLTDMVVTGSDIRLIGQRICTSWDTGLIFDMGYLLR